MAHSPAAPDAGTDPPQNPAPGPRGLVVQAGRGAGACLPLRSPVTLLGRAAGCDVRADAQQVRPLHCLLAPGPDAVTVRALSADGVTVNGRPATTAVLRDGDVLAIGPCQYRLHWPTPAADADPHLEALRVQAAAVVAQQAALAEQELRLRDREAALARQEEQLAGRLEDQRRQLLELQDQITDARAALRQKRAAHAALAEQQQKELAAAREEAAELQRSAKAERQRLSDLRRRLVERGRRHWQARRREHEAQQAELRRDRDRLAAERAQFVEQVEQFHGRAEVDKRRLRAAWDWFERERQQWQAKRAEADAAAAEQVRDLARRAKAAAAAEHKVTADRARLAKDVADRRLELEQLETRIVNARQRLLDLQGEALRPQVVEEPIGTVPAAWADVMEQREAAVQRRAEVLARVAGELADQRLHLAEQFERLLRTQQEWHADRTAALRDLEKIATSFEARDLDLDRRLCDVQAARAAVRAEAEAVARQRLRLEAERVRAESRDIDRRADLDVRAAELTARARALAAQEDGWRSLLRRWGRRRRQEIQRLREEQAACRAERTEWAAARVVWLRLAARLRDERRAAAVRALALERMRAETVEGAGGPAAVKRLERLERQWSAQCAAAARDLDRLQATLTAEAARLDEVSRRVRQDRAAAEARAAVLDDRAAEVEREEQLLTAERARTAGELDAARVGREAAERRAAELRDEADRVARLLIDAAPAVGAEAPPSQAA